MKNVAFFRDKWIPALRSGKYMQTKGVLRSAKNTYCCLGVACDLLIAEGVLSPWGDSTNGSYAIAEGHTAILPPAATEFLGCDEYGEFPGTGITLVSLNDQDEDQFSFDQIADFLESLLPAVDDARAQESEV